MNLSKMLKSELLSGGGNMQKEVCLSLAETIHRTECELKLISHQNRNTNPITVMKNATVRGTLSS